MGNIAYGDGLFLRNGNPVTIREAKRDIERLRKSVFVGAGRQYYVNFVSSGNSSGLLPLWGQTRVTQRNGELSVTDVELCIPDRWVGNTYDDEFVTIYEYVGMLAMVYHEHRHVEQCCVDSRGSSALGIALFMDQWRRTPRRW